MVIWLLPLLGYLLGSVPTGKLIGSYYGIDIQKHGSGNIGFANAIRVLGWKPAVIVLIGDAGKAFVPVFIASRLTEASAYIGLVALATIAGNIYPVWLRFKGGKGIATGFGATVAISPWLAGAGVVMYLLVVGVVRRSAPASIVGSWSLPLFALGIAPAYAPLYLILALLATWTHRTNIRKLLHKTVVYDD